MDVSRILASIAIFYFHVGLYCQIPFSLYGQQAVEYFIFLAGISYVLFSKSKPSRFKELADYLFKRFISLFPVYLMINVGIYLGSFLYPPNLGRPFTVLEFLASTAGISQYLGSHYMTTPMWFIPFIMQVYLLLPLVDWILRRANAVLVIIAATSISYLLVLWFSVLIHTNPGYVFQICKCGSPIFRLPDVCVGVIAGQIMLPGARGRLAGLGAILLFGFLSWLSGLAPDKFGFGMFHLPFSGFVTPGVLYGLTFICLPIFRLMGNKLLRLLGRATLPFFLVQCAALTAVSHKFGQHPVIWVPYFFVCCILAISITVGLDQMAKKVEARLSRSVGWAAG